jgi:epsin
LLSHSCIFFYYPCVVVAAVPSVRQGLTLLEALIKNGSERVVDDARDHLFRIRTLTDFAYHDEGAEKGQGGLVALSVSLAMSRTRCASLCFVLSLAVREKARQLVELLNDTAKIREERNKARELRNKYVGIGQEHGSFGSSGIGRGYSGALPCRG